MTIYRRPHDLPAHLACWRCSDADELCDEHAYRKRLYGDPDGEPTTARIAPVEVRFWRRVDVTPGCWIWIGGKHTGGYGVMSFGDHVMGYAHRFSYELHNGPIPEGLHIDHLCRVRACVNPAHLEPVTNRTNTLRSPVSPTAINARKTHCKRGHEFTPENTYVRPDAPYRNCKTCMNILRRRRVAKRREAS